MRGRVRAVCSYLDDQVQVFEKIGLERDESVAYAIARLLTLSLVRRYS